VFLWDPIGPSTSQIIYDLASKNVLNNFIINLKTLGPVGDIVEVWEINVNEIKNILGLLENLGGNKKQ